MEFNPSNSIIQLCLQGMGMVDKSKIEEAMKFFDEAWNNANDDFERFIAAYYVAGQQESLSSKLQWYQTALQFALKIDDPAVTSALSSLYLNIALCYEGLCNLGNAKKNQELAVSFSGKPSDVGPFYHGTKADLKTGDFLTPGHTSNYKSDLTMNHIYFTALPNGAGLAASLAKGEGAERVYVVEPTGEFENDPNVTNKKFPGNLTRSYRTDQPLRVIGEIADWTKQTPDDIRKWRDKLANNKGDIIN